MHEATKCDRNNGCPVGNVGSGFPTPQRQPLFNRNHKIMLQLTNYSKLPNVIFNSVELTPDEKIMLAYLTNRANNFKREESWFGVPLCDFGSDIGFTDHHKVSAVRDALLELDLIEYKRGGKGKASQYKIKWDSIYNNLTSRYDSENKNECLMDRAFSEKKYEPKTKDFEEDDIPIPKKQKKVIKFPEIPEGESIKYVGERFIQILQDNFVGDERFADDKEYQNSVMDFVASYLSVRYSVSECIIRDEIEVYKNNFIKNTYKTLAV